MATEHFTHGLGARDLVGHFGTGLKQRIHNGRVVARLAMPTKFRAVHCPAERRGVKIVVHIFQRWGEAEYVLDHVGVAVPCGPVERCPAMLTARGHRQAGM